jgi:hypothetical protein
MTDFREEEKRLIYSNVKNERTNVPISFLEMKPKRFGIVPEFVLLRADCFDLVQNLFSWTKQTMSSFDGTDSGMKTHILVSFLLDVGTFVERLWNVCLLLF